MNGLFDWFTISYRTLKFWAMILLLFVLGFLAYRFAPTLIKNLSETPVVQPPIVKRSGTFVEYDTGVTVKKANTMDKVPAARVKSLEEGDIIYCDKTGSAVIILFDGTRYDLKPDSITYISEVREETSTQKRTTGLRIDEGRALITTGGRNVPSSSAELSTEQARVKYGANSHGGASHDKARGFTEIFLYSGEAKARSTNPKDQREVELRPEEVIGIGANKKFEDKKTMPSAPQLISPTLHQSFPSRDVTKLKIDLSWSPVPQAERYRVQVSDTSAFYKVLLDQVVDKKTTHPLSSLRHGVYFWRVSATDSQGVEGPASVPYRFVVVQELKAGNITLVITQTRNMGTTAEGSIYQFKGRTDPGISVTINGESAVVGGDGQFTHFSARPIKGSTVRIEAIELGGVNKVLNHPLPK